MPNLRSETLRLALVLLSTGSQALAGELVQTAEPTVPGEYIVTLKEASADLDAFARSLSPSAKPLVSRGGLGVGSRRPTRPSRLVLVRGASGSDAQQWALRSDVLRVTPNTIGRAAGLRIQNSPEPVSIGLDRVDQRDPRAPGTGVGFYTDSWTGRGVDVFVIDDSIRTTHTDFASGSYSRTVQNVYDATEGNCPTYETSHGTQIASMIGGRVAGVARDANLYGVDIMCGGGTFTMAALIRALYFVRDNYPYPNWAVVNMSIEIGPTGDLFDALESLYENNGGRPVMVAAAGNGATLASSRGPAFYSFVLAVGNVSSAGTTDVWYSTSNYGSKVGMLAPGAGIRAADATSNTSYSSFGDGTSASAALVSGALTRLIQRHGLDSNWTYCYNSGACFSVENGGAYHDVLIDQATQATVVGLPSGTTSRLLFTDAEPPPQNRAHLSATAQSDSVRRVIALPTAGESLVAGELRNQMVTLPCAGGVGSTAFVQRRDASGNSQWTTDLGWACVTNVATGLGVDSFGSIYTVVQTNNQNSGENYFTVYKLSAGGAVVWSRTLNVSTYSTYATDLAVFYQGTDPTILVVGHTYDIIPGLPVLGGWDAFALGYTASGNQRFFTSVGSTYDDFATAATINAGSGFIAGFTGGVLPNATSFTGASVSTNLGGYDGYIVRLGLTNGSPQRTLQFGTSGNEFDLSLSRQANGFIGIAGATTGALGPLAAGAGGLADVFVAKIDATSLNSNWLQRFGSAGAEAQPGVSADNTTGDVWVSASTNGNLFATNPGGSDAVIAKFSTNGRFHWGDQSAASGNETAPAIAIPTVSTTTEIVEVFVGGTTSSTWPVGSYGGGATDGYLRVVRGL